MRATRFAAVVCTCLFLAACGGGGGGGSSSTGSSGSNGTGGGSGGGGNNPPPPSLPFELLSNALGSVQINGVKTAFMGNGDGVAVWFASTGYGQSELLYSVYDAGADSWSADQILGGSTQGQNGFIQYAVAEGDNAIAVVFAEGTQAVYGAVFQNGQFNKPQLLDQPPNATLQIGAPVIATTGTGFAAVWTRQESYDSTAQAYASVVRGSVLAPGASDWSAATTISSAGKTVTDPRIASNGSSYLAVWMSTAVGSSAAGDLVDNYYVNASWQPSEAQLDTGISRGFAVASNGSDYQAVWLKQNGMVDSVRGALVSSTFAVSAPQWLESDSQSAQTVEIASNGTKFLVAWTEPGALMATMGAGATWPSPAELDSVNANVYSYVLASDGHGFGVAWTQYDSTSVSTRVMSVWASIYTTSWSAAKLIENQSRTANTGQDALALLYDGSDYVAGFELDDFNSTSPRQLWSNAFGGTAWGTAAVLGDLDSYQRPPVMLARRGSHAVAAWVHQRADDSGQAVDVAARTAAWAAPRDLATTARGHSVDLAYSLGNAAGQTLAIWVQPRGSTLLTYAAVQSANGNWSTPTLLMSSNINNFGASTIEAAVASDTGFAILRRGPTDNATGETDAYARVYDGQAWGAETKISAGLAGANESLYLASNGSGYAAVWQLDPPYTTNSPSSIQASIYDGTSWSAPTQLAVASSTGYAQAPQVASNGTGYAVTWDDSDDSVPINIYDGKAWSGAQAVVSSVSTHTNLFPTIASNGTGYMLLWSAQGSIKSLYASISPDGTSAGFGSPQRVSDNTADAYSPLVASDGTGYALAWQSASNTTEHVATAVWDGTSWSGAQVRDSGANGGSPMGLAASATGYALLWQQGGDPTVGSTDLVAEAFDGKSWGSPTTLDTLGPSNPLEGSDFGRGTHLASNGTTYAVTWPGKDATDGLNHVQLAVFDSGAWKTQQLEMQSASADDSVVTAVGSHYTVLWAQPDPSGDPQVALPWAYSGLP